MNRKDIHLLCWKKAKMWSFVLLAATLAVTSCGDDDYDFLPEYDYNTLNDGIADDVKYFNNPPYPTNANPLRILAIGSSFTDDATYYLDNLVKASDIDEDRLCIYKIVEGFSRFNTWIDKSNKEETLYAKRVTGNVEMKGVGTLKELLSQAWDVIVINQASDASYKWESYSSLKPYMDIILEACTNKNVCFAFQLQWSHTPGEMPYVMQGNTACCQKMAKRYGVNVIIPCGTAIQIARGTSLNDSKYMTRDRYHLNHGMGCYIASCVWFQKLLSPVFGCNVVGNKAVPYGSHTSDDIRLGQRCAEYAVNNTYDYTHSME